MSPKQNANPGVIQFPSADELTSNTVNSPSVLIVDDDEDNLLVMAYLLDMLDVSFLATNNGYEGLEIANLYNFSLVLLDVLMPKFSGIHVLKRLRRNIHYTRTPVIAVTALAFKKDRSRLLAAGFTDCLIKPYEIDDVSLLTARYLSTTCKARQHSSSH